MMNVTLLLNERSWISEWAQRFVAGLSPYCEKIQVVEDHLQLSNGDVCFILGYTRIIPAEFLQLHSYNMVIHESDLPEGKGGSPLAWQILEGKKSIVFSLIEASEEVDSGDIWLKQFLHLNGTELCDEWREKQGEMTLNMCQTFLSEKDRLKPMPQSGKGSTYRLRTPADSELDVHQSIAEQFELLRVVDNQRYPAFFTMNGSKYKLSIEKA